MYVYTARGSLTDTADIWDLLFTSPQDYVDVFHNLFLSYKEEEVT